MMKKMLSKLGVGKEAAAAVSTSRCVVVGYYGLAVI